MPTIIGLLFLVAAIYCFFQKDDKLFGLVIISSIFHASSVIATEEHGVEPYYPVAAIFVFQTIYRRRLLGRNSRSFKGKRWMIAFAIIGICSALLLPVVFAGTPVYDPYVGIDNGLLVRLPLHLGLANFTQSAYLLLDVLVVIGAAQNRFRGNFSKKAYMFTFYFLAGTVFIQFLCSVLGITFPYEVLQNHGGYDLQVVHTGEWSARYPGTFPESSGAGLVLASFTAGFLAARLKFGRPLFPVLVGLFAIFLVRSTGSLLATGIVFVMLLVAHPILRFPFSVDTLMLKRSGLLIVTAILAVLLAWLSPLRDSLLDLTVGKQDSSSYINRLASDAYAIDLVIQTKGLGVGMGSNRPSSMLTSLLSTVGVMGLVAFLVTFVMLLMNAGRQNSWIRWVGFALFIDIAFSDPDYTSPLIWIFLAYAVQMGNPPISSNGARSTGLTPSNGQITNGAVEVRDSRWLGAQPG